MPTSKQSRHRRRPLLTDQAARVAILNLLDREQAALPPGEIAHDLEVPVGRVRSALVFLIESGEAFRLRKPNPGGVGWRATWLYYTESDDDT